MSPKMIDPAEVIAALNADAQHRKAEQPSREERARKILDAYLDEQFAHWGRRGTPAFDKRQGEILRELGRVLG